MVKNIKQIHYAQMVNMGGIKVRQPLPSAHATQVDPFLLLHHHATHLPGGEHPSEVGIGPHPHRGFSPVTFIFKGSIQHRDSEGNNQIVEAGGVQWMSAGKGIIHSERPSAQMAEQGGALEIIQLWINTPQHNKLDAPFYKAISKEMMPEGKSGDGKMKWSLLSGEVNGQTGPVQPSHPLLALSAEAQEGATHTFVLPAGMHSLIYLLDGSLEVSGPQAVEGLNMIEFSPDVREVSLKALRPTRFILLASPPLNEPLATYGPFVMNTSRELMQAMDDYQLGKMGVLEEEF